MKRKVTGLSVAFVLVLVVFALPTKLNLAQGRSQVVLSNEAGHALTPPLGSMPPRSAEGDTHRAIPLRYPHPLFGGAQPVPDGALQTATGPLVSTTSGQNFIGVGVGLAGATSDRYAPPDTNGAAGATQFVQWVNVSFAVFNKTDGSLAYGPTLGNSLWSALGGPCAANNSGDPIAQYDKQAGRWVMMQPVFKSPYYICAAVSLTSDATGSWNVYAFPVNPSNIFPDYPKLSVWPDGYYLSYNQFQGNTFAGAAACALDRANMLAGTPANPMQCFSTSASYGSLLPSDLDGAVTGVSGTTAAPPMGAPATFLNFGSNSLNLWQFHVDWTNPSNSRFTGPTNLKVASFSQACGGGVCVPQPNTKQQLDSLGDRLMYRLAYRNFGTVTSPDQHLVATHSVAIGSGSKRSPGYTGIRWYELRNTGSGWSVLQQGTFAPDSNFRWMGSIAMDKVGDIAVGYSVSSSTVFPSIRYTGRVPTDPTNSLESENAILNGAGSQTVNLNRWGDYSSMAVDPADDCTFWYTTEYLQKNGTFNWSTRIASFKFPGCQ